MYIKKTPQTIKRVRMTLPHPRHAPNLIWDKKGKHMWIEIALNWGLHFKIPPGFWGSGWGSNFSIALSPLLSLKTDNCCICWETEQVVWDQISFLFKPNMLLYIRICICICICISWEKEQVVGDQISFLFKQNILLSICICICVCICICRGKEQVV